MHLKPPFQVDAYHHTLQCKVSPLTSTQSEATTEILMQSINYHNKYRKYESGSAGATILGGVWGSQPPDYGQGVIVGW